MIVWNVTTNQSFVLQTSSPQPPGRARHAACLHDHYMYIHGGHCHKSGSVLLDDFWRLDLLSAQWTKLNPKVNAASLTDDMPPEVGRKPSMRYGHYMTSYGGKVFMALGCVGPGAGLADVWAYDVHGNYWDYVQPQGKSLQPRAE